MILFKREYHRVIEVYHWSWMQAVSTFTFLTTSKCWQDQNEMFKGCVADCPVVADLFSMSQLRASFQYLGMALHKLSETQMIQTERHWIKKCNFHKLPWICY